MGLHDLLLSLVALVSEFLGTLSGFGSSTFFVPAAIFFETAQLVLVLTAILHCFGNSWKIIMFRRHLAKKHLIFLGLPSIVFTALGAVGSKYISPVGFRVGLGIALILLSAVSLLMKSKISFWGPKTRWGVTALSGLLTGLFGTGGALRGFALSTMELEKSAFVALSSSIDIGGDVLRAGIYLNNGFMDWQQWYYFPLLGLAAFIGAWLGKQALKRLSQNSFEKIVAGFIFLSGLLLLLKK